jgi:hypothetical protein
MYNVGHLVESNAYIQGPLNIDHQKMTNMVENFYK